MSRKIIHEVEKVDLQSYPLWTDRNLRWLTYKEKFIELMRSIYKGNFDSYSKIISEYPELVLDSLIVFSGKTIPMYALQWCTSLEPSRVARAYNLNMCLTTDIPEINKEISIIVDDSN